MPLFFLDVHDGNTLTPDVLGHDFSSLDAARDGAAAVLPTLALRHAQGGRRHDVAVDVRDAGRALLFTATLPVAAQQIR